MANPVTITATGEGGINTLVMESRPGDPIRAADWNAVRTTVQQLSQIGRANGEQVLVNGAGKFHLPDTQGNQQQIFNIDNVNTIPAYGVVLFNSIYQNTTPIPVIGVKQPDVYGSQYNAYVNSGQPIGPTKIGICQTAMTNGAAFLALYDSADGTPSPGELWGCISGTYKLKKGAGGFRILATEDLANHYVWVQPVPMLFVRGKPTGDVAAGGTGTLNIYTGTFGSETIFTGQSVSARNDSSCTIKASKMATARYVFDNNLWQFTDGSTS